MIDMNVLRDLTNAFGPSGFEEDVVRAVRKHCTGMSLTNDAMNNVYARIGGNAEGRKPVLMLDAHTDECGFMVQGIMENGLLSLIMLGGMDLPSIPAHTLLVRTRAGKLVKGITTSRPVHFMTDKEKSAPLDIREMFLDVGACSKKRQWKASVSISVIRLLRKLHSSMMKSMDYALARPLTTVWAVPASSTH